MINSKKLQTVYTLILFAIAIVMRLWLIYTSQHFLDGDEAVVGLMSKHIIDNGEIPLFWYGLHYNGGCSWEAFLGASMMILGGYSDISLKFSPLIISVILIYFIYRWSKENFGGEIAVLTIFFYIFSVTFIQWNLKLRGHLALVTIIAVLFWAYYRFLYKNTPKRISSWIVGLLSGAAIWCMASSIIVIFVFFLFWFHQNRRFLISADFRKFFIAFIIGSIPLIYENLKYNFINVKHLFMGGASDLSLWSVFAKIPSNLISRFPKLFHWDNVHNYSESIPWFAWIGYLIAVIAFIYFLVGIYKPLLRWVKALISKSYSENCEAEKLLFIAVYVVIFLLIFTFSSFSEMSPRYLLVIMPCIFLIIALFVVKLLRSSRYVLRVTGIVILSIWLIMGVSQTYAVSKNYFVLDGYTKSYGPDLYKLIDSLKKNNIKFAYSEKFTKYRIIFYSREDIIVSRFITLQDKVYGLPPFSLYPKYEEVVMKSDEQKAFVFGDQPEVKSCFEDFLSDSNLQFKKEIVGNYAIYYDIEPVFHCGEFLNFVRQKDYVNYKDKICL